MLDTLLISIKTFVTVSILLVVSQMLNLLSVKYLVFGFVLLTMALIVFFGFLSLISLVSNPPKGATIDYPKIIMAIFGGALGIKATLVNNIIIELAVLVVIFSMFNIIVVTKEPERK